MGFEQSMKVIETVAAVVEASSCVTLAPEGSKSFGWTCNLSALFHCFTVSYSLRTNGTGDTSRKE